MRTVVWVVLAVGLALASTPSGARAQKKKQRDVITREEILNSSLKDQDLLVVIKALRPQFLQAARGPRSLGGAGTSALSVYIDRSRQPGTDILRQVTASTVEEVRYLDPSQSENEYGITANGGAIVIKLAKVRSVPDSLSKKPPR
jgi:hypothetical protein